MHDARKLCREHAKYAVRRLIVKYNHKQSGVGGVRGRVAIVQTVSSAPPWRLVELKRFIVAVTT